MTIEEIKACRPAWEAFFASAAAVPSLHDRGDNSTDLARSILSSSFGKLAARLTEHRKERAAYRRRTADGFTVFDFIKPTENVLSDILVFFLDPMASHGQGPCFLRSLIRQLRPDLSLDCKHPMVAREALTYSIPRNRRRIDILITLDDFVLAIETKQFTGEGREQIRDYSEHLQNIAGHLPFCLIFLSRTGAEASSIAPENALTLKAKRQLTSWSWEKDIPSWLRVCRKECGADKVRHFLDDFTEYIGAYLATQQEMVENNENE